MVVCRALGLLVGMLVAVPLAWGQTWTLAEPVKAGDCSRIKMEMSLTGELRVHRDNQIVPIKLEASARHEFPERVLNVDKTGLAEKTARVYDLAKAVISVGGNRSERTLRGERRLIVVQRRNDQPLVYSPNGALSREELELTSEHFDTLCLTGLLPVKPVAVGNTWKLANAVVQGLCNFEGLTEQDLTCKLEEVTKGSARVLVTGSVEGIELGSMVKLKVQAWYRFDLQAKKLVQIEWQQTDERAQGPASPATVVQTLTKLTRSAIAQPSCLDDVALVSVPDGEPPLPVLQIDYHDPKGRFDLLHGREWQMVAQTDEHLILRLMERGDFVAQVTLTPWKPAEKGKHLSLEEFRAEMNKTPGWELEKEVQAGEVPATDGNKIYRISAVGNMDGTPVMQNFYLVAGPDGEQVVLLFTLTPKKAPKLGDRDVAMAGSVAFPPHKKQADKPR